MTQEYLKFNIGSHLRNCIIKNIDKISIKVPSSEEPNKYTDAEKICLTVEDRNNKEFKISDIWVTKDGNLTIKGLWFTLSEAEKLSPSSSLAQLLDYYDVNTLEELIEKQVKVFPDEKNYLVIVACDHEKIT